MFKVLLVDDEPWALKSIENGLNWREFGFEITGRYQSIDIALEHMVSEIPHVVVTDIRVAGNNGLDLIKWIRERGLDIEIVVVTGYSDFHVAQAAIKLGVFDFLLKPINLDEGDAFLKKLSSHLRQKTAEQRSRIKKAFENVSVADFIASLSNKKEDYQTGILRAVTIRGDIEKKEIDALDLDSRRIITAGHDKNVLLLNDRYYFENYILSLLSKIKDTCSVGVSRPASGKDKVYTAIIKSDIMSYHNFITGKNDIYFYSSTHYKEIAVLADRIINSFSSPENAMSAVEICNHILHSGYNVQDLTQLFNFLLAPLKLDASVAELTDYTQLCDRFTDAKHFVTYIMDTLYSHPAYARRGDTNLAYMQALHYINTNFIKNISLSEIAQKLNISPSYLSEIFSKNCGMSFSKYVSNLRNARAKELLSSTDIPIQDVAEHSGFKDYFYFSRQFKKNYGITPSEFRKRSKKG